MVADHRSVSNDTSHWVINFAKCMIGRVMNAYVG
jgi:hypothetical protein